MLYEINELKTLSYDDTFALPEEKGRTIINAVNSASYCIDICVYEIGCPVLGKALANALDKGVKVRIIVNGALHDKKTGISMIKFFNDWIKQKRAEKGNDIDWHWSSNDFNLTHAKYILVDHLDERYTNFKFRPSYTKLIVNTGNFLSYPFQNFMLHHTPFDENEDGFWGNCRDFGVVLNTQSKSETIGFVANIFNKDFLAEKQKVADTDLKELNSGIVISNGAYQAGQEYYPDIAGYPHNDQNFIEGWVSNGNTRVVLESLIKGAESEIIIGSQDIVGIDVIEMIRDVITKKNIQVTAMCQFAAGWVYSLNILKSAGANVYVNMEQNSVGNSHNSTTLPFYHHAKYMIVDRRIAYIGSINLDVNSIMYARELGTLTSDRDVISQLIDLNAFDTHRGGTKLWSPEAYADSFQIGGPIDLNG